MTPNIDRIATGISGSREEMRHRVGELAAGQKRVAPEFTEP
jgi:hypothetical protein